MKYRHRPIVIEAVQWFKNGDHPLDHCETTIINDTPRMSDGKVVRRYRISPAGVYADHLGDCMECKHSYLDHGKVDTEHGVVKVCPGDWIVKTFSGFYMPVKPELFDRLYEPYAGA